MDGADHHSAVGDALGILIQGMTPFVARVIADVLPPGVEWTELLRRKDLAARRRVSMYRSRDLSLMLRATTERLGDLGYPFGRHLVWLIRQIATCAWAPTRWQGIVD